MPTINAWQHIFSNVEEEKSPRGRGGFQTLFHSPELTEAEVEETEARFLYFASKIEPVKQLFFTISSGKGVVAQVVFLPAPDQFGRGGRYFAHGLVFAAEDLPKFQADPFRVFRAFSFITTVDQALAQGDFNSGHIESTSLTLPDNASNDVTVAQKWSVPELKQLWLLALRVEQQTAERNAVTFTGPPEQIAEAIEAAFLAVPVALRSQCTFDTYFYRCNLVATYFWAVGLPQPPVAIKFAQVNAPTRRVEGNIPPGPTGAYERWVMDMLESGNLSAIPPQRDYAYALGEWLDGRAYDLELLNRSSADLISAVFKSSPQSVQEAVRRGVSQKLAPELIDRASTYIYANTSKQVLYKQLRQGFELPQLVEILYDSYAAENFTEPSKGEIKAVDKLLEQVTHPMFYLFVAYWNNPKKELPKALNRAETADYRHFVETALKLKLVKPFTMLLPTRTDDFLDIYLAQPGPNITDLAEELIELEQFDHLSQLNSFLSNLSRKEINKLARLAVKQEEIPESFQTAVDQAIAALPPEKGLMGKIKSLWGG